MNAQEKKELEEQRREIIECSAQIREALLTSTTDWQALQKINRIISGRTLYSAEIVFQEGGRRRLANIRLIPGDSILVSVNLDEEINEKSAPDDEPPTPNPTDVL